MRVPQTVALLLIASLLLGACALATEVSQLFVTPTPSDEPTLAPEMDETPTPRPTSTATASPTATNTPRPTVTPQPTQIPTPTPASSADAFAIGMSARHNGDYARAIAAFQIALNLKPSADLAREAQFRLGEAYRRAGDDDRALAALNVYLQSNPTGAHALETHYFLADILGGERKDYASALAHLRTLRQQTKTLQADTDARIADLLARAGDSNSAIAQYDRALQDNTLSTASRVSILMRAAAVHLQRGEATLAAARDDAALALASDAYTRAALNYSAGQAYAAANQMNLAPARWNSAIKDTPDQPSAFQALTELTNRNIGVDDYQRGLVNYHADKYDEAISAFQRYLQGEAKRPGDAHYYLARAYTARGAYAQAIAEYDVIINTLPKDARVPDAFMGKASANAAVGKIDEAVNVYKQFAAWRPEAARADEALLRAGVLLESVQRYREAAALFEQLQTGYPTRKNAAEALFRAGLDYHRLQDDQTASARWQLLVQKYRSSDFYTGALYWLGKVAMARKQAEQAKNFWTQAAALAPEVFRPFPRSYYAYRARAMLKSPPTADERRVYDLSRYAMDLAAARPELEKWLTSWIKPPVGSLGNLDASIRGELYFRRGEELLQLDRIVEARTQFAALIDARENDAPALYALARYFQEKGLYALSINCADRLALLAMLSSAPAAPRGLMLLRYPTYYADLVVAESQANRVDPLLYFAVLRLESHFDPWAQGPVGERGLAQISPPIAPSIVAALKVQDFRLDQLYQPYLSVRFGNWLFAQNSKKLDDPIYAFAAYNAGLGAALRWQEPDVDLAVESFDIDMARLYVHIVYPNWQEYQALYR